MESQGVEGAFGVGLERYEVVLGSPMFGCMLVAHSCWWWWRRWSWCFVLFWLFLVVVFGCLDK